MVLDPEALNRFFWKLILTSGGGFFTIVGIIALVVWRKRLMALFGGSEGEDVGEQGKSKDVALLERFMTAYERNTEAFIMTARAQERMVEILNGFKDQMRELSTRMDRIADKVRCG